ncbi:MAG: uL30 family ribosomal protein [Nanoarchaeota archaeon]|nr:uL30 family ribosomal protein [Nanoarchaeota archaeon]
MIVIIRIKGMVDRNRDIVETLSRLRLRRKYSCVVLAENDVIKGMLQKVRSFIAYGEIDKDTLVELIKARGQLIDKADKIDAEKIADEIIKKGNMKDLKIKPFFRLHPARGGIVSKQHFPKGVLGNHGVEINKLVRRML